MMKRIAILGRGGAGKSTLASYLATRYKLPVFELDQYSGMKTLRLLQ